MDKKIDMRIMILVGAVGLLIAIVAVTLIVSSSGEQSSGIEKTDKTARVSAPLSVMQLRAQARRHSLPGLFSWAAPDQKVQARAALMPTSGQLRVGYLEPSFKAASEKSRQKSTVFIVSETPGADLDISKLKKTASAVITIPGAKVYVPPEALVKQGQLFVLANDRKLVGLVSSIFTTRRQLQQLAHQMVLIKA